MYASFIKQKTLLTKAPLIQQLPTKVQTLTKPLLHYNFVITYKRYNTSFIKQLTTSTLTEENNLTLYELKD